MEWIDIKERQPNHGDIVLFAADLDAIWEWGHKKVLLGKFIPIGDEKISIFVLHPTTVPEGGIITAIPCTHWMPLPEIPESLT